MSLVSVATASESHTCAQCGFSGVPLSRAAIAERISSAVESFIGVERVTGSTSGTRPSEGRWSVLEYGGHLRDVLLSVRERVVLASILDVPAGAPIYRDERTDLGFYAQDTASEELSNCKWLRTSS
jgi:hypothetical protein